MTTMIWRLMPLFAVAVLTACGGGGGGASNASAQGNMTAPGLQLSATAVTFEVEPGDPEPRSMISGVVNDARGPVYVFVQHTNKGIASVGFNQTTSNGGDLYIQGRDVETLPTGTLTDEIRVDVCYDYYCTTPVLGSPQLVQVTYKSLPAVTTPAVILSDSAIAFSKTPQGERLTQTIKVDNSSSRTGTWSATSSEKWLSVTTTGVFDGNLTITANPQGLAPGLHTALVNVASNDPAQSRPSMVRVGLYLSASAGAVTFNNVLGDQMLMDPSRPFVYSLKDSVLSADHVYTGQRLYSLKLDGVQFTDMTINPSGSLLFLADANQKQIWVISTDQAKFLTNLPLPDDPTRSETRRTPVVFQANGKDYLAVIGLSPSATRSGYYMYNLTDGRSMSQLFGVASMFADTVTTSSNGQRVAVHTGYSPNAMRWFQFGENSKGALYARSHAGGSFISSKDSPLNSSYFVANDRDVSYSCRGVLQEWVGSTFPMAYTIIDNPMNLTSAWVDPTAPNSCSRIESFEDDLMFMANGQYDTFQVRDTSGQVLYRWNNPILPSKPARLTSDFLRLIGNDVMLDLPR